MMNKIIDKLVGVRPLELLPVLAVVLCHENEGGAQEVFDVWGINIPATDLLQGNTVGFELRSEEPRANGAGAEPAAGCTDVELAAEYFCVKVVGAGV